MPFSAVEKQVTADASRAKAAELAKQNSEQFKASLNKGAKPEELSKQMNVSWQTKTNIARDDQTLPGQLVLSIFDAPKPAPKATTPAQIVSLGDGDVAVMEVLAVNPGDVSKNSADIQAAVSQRIAQVMSILDYQAYVKDVLAKTKVKVYEKGLAKPES
jgi:hypothetical protein